MNTSSCLFLRSPFRAALAIATCLAVSAVTASAQDFRFNNGNGGSGTWEDGAGGTPWQDNGVNNTPYTSSSANVATFQNNGGTVNVAADVTAGYMIFNANSAETLNGTGTITIATGNGVFENDTNNNVTIDNNLQLDDSIDSDRFDIGDGGNNTVTFNGNISYVGSNVRPSGQALIFNGGANTNFVLNGSFSGSPTVPGRLILSGGTITLNGDFSGANPSNLLEVDQGNVYLGSSNLGTGQIGLGGGVVTTPVVLTVGAQHITNTISAGNYAFTNPFTSGSVVIGGSTASVSTYDSINTIVTGLTLTAVSGGRVNIGTISGNGDVSGLIKTGAGTVVLTANSNETVFNGFNGQTAPYLSDIQQGRLLVNSTASGSQSAFGTDAGNIQVEGGATLGGTGSVLGTQKVVAVTGSSIIAPGDSGADLGTPTIGTLHLMGGLTVASGATLAFKINGDAGFEGTNNDLLDLGGGDFTPAGNLTFDFANLGTIQTSQPGSPNFYTVISGSGFWDDSGVTGYTFNAPPGYVVARYNFDSFGDTFSVDFQVVPEPSTYALMLGGLAFLAFCVRRKTALLK
jgi:fibronectin-binding autotransporter adhesin